MFITALFFIAMAVGVGLVRLDRVKRAAWRKKEDKRYEEYLKDNKGDGRFFVEKSYYRSGTDYAFGGWATIIAACISYILPAVIITANAIHSDNNSKNSGEILDLKIEQRDELIAGIRSDLSDESFIKLMSATDEAEITVMFGSGVSDFLVARATTIVNLNAEVNELKTEIAKDRRSVCNETQNPLIPMLPFFAPECKLGGES